MVVSNVTFPCVLVYEWQTRKGWTTGDRRVVACVNLKIIVKVCRIWINMMKTMISSAWGWRSSKGILG